MQSPWKKELKEKKWEVEICKKICKMWICPRFSLCKKTRQILQHDLLPCFARGGKHHSPRDRHGIKANYPTPVCGSRVIRLTSHRHHPWWGGGEGGGVAGRWAL